MAIPPDGIPIKPGHLTKSYTPGPPVEVHPNVIRDGVCPNCNADKIRKCVCTNCGTRYVPVIPRKEYKPYNDPTMDKRFHAVGLKALRGATQVELVARVNHLDNFTLWAAQIVAGAIIDAVDTKEREDLDWFQAWHDQLEEPYAASMRDHPMVRDIAQTVYNELREAAHV